MHTSVHTGEVSELHVCAGEPVHTHREHALYVCACTLRLRCAYCPGGVEDMHTLHRAICMHMHTCSHVHCQRG